MTMEMQLLKTVRRHFAYRQKFKRLRAIIGKSSRKEAFSVIKRLTSITL